MPTNLSYQIVGNTITCIVDGQVYTINTRRNEAEEICEILNDPNPDTDRLKLLFNRASAIESYCHNEVVVKGNQVFYEGKPIHNSVTKRILDFMSRGLPYKPLIAFLKRLMKNPSMNSVEQLYPFMEHVGLQITSEGMIIAYKGVRDNYYDCHSGTIRNMPGDSPESLRRNEVDDDPDVGCSYGYHVGSWQYAHTFGRRVMRVLVDPAEIVSVPHECANQKVRCTYYEVLDEVDVSIFDVDEICPYSSEC